MYLRFFLYNFTANIHGDVLKADTKLDRGGEMTQPQTQGARKERKRVERRKIERGEEKQQRQERKINSMINQTLPSSVERITHHYAKNKMELITLGR